MPFRLSAGAASETGPHRNINQDAAFVASWAVAVADGVGGGPAGDLASAAMVHRLTVGRGVADAEALGVRVRVANWDLGAQVRRRPELSGMATTLTSLWCAGDGTVLLAHVGDSRAYRVRDGVLSRQTRDDSFVQALVEQGLVRAEDAMTHPRRNIITESFHGHEDDPVRVVEADAAAGDRWLLCSDGVSDYVPEELLCSLLQSDADPSAAAARVAQTALAAGSRDNVTAVVCDVQDAAPGDEQPVLAGAAAVRFAERLDWAG